MKKLVLLLFLMVAWSMSTASDVSDARADALGYRIMEALAAAPVDCPPRFVLPSSVLFCGQFPPKEKRDDIDGIKGTIDDIILGSSPAVPAFTPGKWSRDKEILLRAYRLGEVPIQIIVDLDLRVAVMNYPHQLGDCLKTQRSSLEDRLTDVTPPVAHGASPPSVEYPELARVARLEGTVQLQAMIMKDGTVGEVCVLWIDRPGMGFEEAAIDAIKKWPFDPATLGDEPIEFPVQLNLYFKLH